MRNRHSKFICLKRRMNDQVGFTMKEDLFAPSYTIISLYLVKV